MNSSLSSCFESLPYSPKCVILSERQRVEESTHYRYCMADLRCEDPSIPLRSTQDDAPLECW